MVNIQVCVGSACHLKGSYSVISSLQELVAKNKLEDSVNISAVFCLGNCSSAVSVKFEEEDTVYSVDPKNVGQFFDSEVKKRI